MSNNYHSPIPAGAAANATSFNGPLGQLDAQIDRAVMAAQAAQAAVLTTGAAATLANGAASAGQKVINVDSAAIFAVGCDLQYALAGGTLESNQVATINSATQITLVNNIGAGGIADNGLVAVVPAGVANMRAGEFNARDYNARPGGSAATNRAAINAAIAAAPAGSTVVLPDFYDIDDGILITKAVNIVGRGPQSGVRLVSGGTVTNGNAFWFRSNMDANSASAPYFGPVLQPTYYRTFSGTVSEGARTFTLAATTGLTVGTEVLLLLGVDPYDSTQPFLRLWNRVASIAGSSVTFALAVPEDVNGTSHKCVTLENIVQNCGVSDLTIRWDGVFSMEIAVYLDKCRNVWARNINLDGAPRGVTVEACENAVVENVFAARLTHTLLGGWGFTNLLARNLTALDCQGTALYFESQARGALIENVKIGRGATASAVDPTVTVAGGSRGIHLANVHLTNAVATFDLALVEEATVTTENWFLWNSEYHRKFPLRQHRGLLWHNEKLYHTQRTWSRRFPLNDTMPLDLGLPSGVYTDIRVFVSNTANLAQFTLQNAGDLKPYLTAGALVRPAMEILTHVGRDADYQFNNTEVHATVLQCSGMPAGNYGMIQIDYYEPSASDDDGQRGAQQALPLYVGVATWDVGNLADGQNSTTQLTVPGANVGCPCVAALSSITTGNWQISAYCYAPEAVRVVVTNHTGGTVDLPSGTLRVVALQWVG